VKDGNYLIGLLTNKSAVWLPGSSLEVGLRATCWTNFIHSVFWGMLLRVAQDPLFEKGKKETKKGATKEDPGFASCVAEFPPGKEIEDAASLPLSNIQWLRRRKEIPEISHIQNLKNTLNKKEV